MRALKMKKILSLSLFLACSVQVGHAAAIKETANLKTVEKSSSLIVKALDQQKRNPAALPSSDELKMLNNMRTTPTQSFFATQNERFTRFVQTIFPQQNS